MNEARFVAEQLWPHLGPPEYLVLDDVEPPAGWVEIERHRAIGRSGRITMLIPFGRRAAAAALASYSGLRPPGRRMARVAAALGLRTGVLCPRRRVSIAAPLGQVDRADTVLEQLEVLLDCPVGAVMHVRRTANRKALLQVVDKNGRTLGFAKVARDAQTSAGIRTEIQMLEELRGGSDLVRVPRVLAKGFSGDCPFVFTEPLPRDIRRVRASIADAPSVSECADFAPFARWAGPLQTGHVQKLGRRLSGLRLRSRGDYQLQGALQELLAGSSFGGLMPVVKWWHGDFSFWNAGRTPGGTLWLWDLENAERDALAGLDVLHWHASRRRARAGAVGLTDQTGILADSSAVLRAYGLPDGQAQRALFRIYVAEIGTRTLETVAAEGWSRVWCRSEELEDVVRAALR